VTYPDCPKDDGIPIPQLLTMQQISTITVFQSNYRFLAAAWAVMVLGVLVVVPTFAGVWELERTPLLNPLQIALAFNA